MERYREESGMTLVEILAAIVILTIVFISFFAFFTQSATFTKHNKEKLTAVQVAEELVGKVRGAQSLADFMALDLGDGITPDPVSHIYENATIYPDYNVKIEIGSSPIASLNKAIITVETDTDIGIKGSSFTTEMFFSEPVVTPGP